MSKPAFFFILLLASAQANSSVIDDAKSLLKQGKAAESAALLESRVTEFAGDSEFNYLLGIALLDTGKPSLAVFAFERALAIDPRHIYARAELGRALIALSDFESARRELLQVEQHDLPPEMAERVRTLLAQLKIAQDQEAEVKERTRSTWRAYIEGEFGNDTNINTGPNTTLIYVPAIYVPVTLRGLATSQESGLVGINGGLFGSLRISQDAEIYGSLDGRFRHYWDESGFKPGSVSAGAGLRLTKETDQFSVGLTKFEYYIGDKHYDDQTGVYGAWQRNLSKQNQVGLFVQKLRIDHPIASYLNTDILLAGGNWLHSYQGRGDPKVNMTLYYGDEDERDNAPTIGRQFSGFRIGADIGPTENIKLFGSFGVQHSQYGGRDPFFLKSRKDFRYDLSVGATYMFSPRWSLTSQFSYTRNDSTIPVNDFDREQFLLTLRREFF